MRCHHDVVEEVEAVGTWPARGTVLSSFLPSVVVPPDIKHSPADSPRLQSVVQSFFNDHRPASNVDQDARLLHAAEERLVEQSECVGGQWTCYDHEVSLLTQLPVHGVVADPFERRGRGAWRIKRRSDDGHPKCCRAHSNRLADMAVTNDSDGEIVHLAMEGDRGTIIARWPRFPRAVPEVSLHFLDIYDVVQHRREDVFGDGDRRLMHVRNCEPWRDSVKVGVVVPGKGILVKLRRGGLVEDRQVRLDYDGDIIQCGRCGQRIVFNKFPVRVQIRLDGAGVDKPSHKR
mmetsp:Transcript_16777/g.41301  ORF Transcript_16777/g.41301 Transcript_16777/m.41301 type:complete len:289 (+) Transcript_16777:394-1260(+)